MHCVQSNQTVHNKQTWTLLSDEKIVEEVIDLVEEMVRKTQQSCEDIAKEEETCCAICLEQMNNDDKYRSCAWGHLLYLVSFFW